eukprot:UN02891
MAAGHGPFFLLLCLHIVHQWLLIATPSISLPMQDSIIRLGFGPVFLFYIWYDYTFRIIDIQYFIGLIIELINGSWHGIYLPGPHFCARHVRKEWKISRWFYIEFIRIQHKYPLILYLRVEIICKFLGIKVK